MTNISLSFEEGMLAGMQGIIQMMRSIRQGKVGYEARDLVGREMRVRWADVLLGQFGEHVISKAIGAYPVASADGIKGDDPGGLAIRTTGYPNGCLIVFNYELPKWDDKVFVLVTGHWPDFRIPGWIYGREANFPEFLRTGKEPRQWWVPQDALHPFSEMPLPQREIPK